MSRVLPPRPNLEYLKKQAKELLAERLPSEPAWALSDAQHALAREYGFPSWPKLRAHVEASATSPFVGVWRANVARSSRHPLNPFRVATLQFTVAGDAVTIEHEMVDGLGKPDRGVNTIVCDGIERPQAYGIQLAASWKTARVIEVMTRHAGLPARAATYEVSRDDRTMTVRTVDQEIILERVQ
jgi:hypothetical protein